MKTKYLIGGLVLASTALAGCDDFINDNRFPITSEVNSPTFWSSESNVIQECDRMKNFFDGYGYGNATGSFYFSQLSDDQAGNAFRDWTFTNVPASGGYWTTGYTNLRHIMCIIDGVRSSQLDENLKKKYEGIARLMRAYTFTELVKRYGDVTWLEKTVQVSSTNVLYGPRTARDLVMDSVLRDLDYAVATIPAKSAKDDWSRDLALAIKSDVCLYEGTFCRYRTRLKTVPLLTKPVPRSSFRNAPMPPRKSSTAATLSAKTTARLTTPFATWPSPIPKSSLPALTIP